MSLYRKSRKLILKPRLFFADAKKNKIKSTTGTAGKVASVTQHSKPDQEIYNQLVNFARNYSVNDLKLKDDYLWPYLRHHILVQLTAVSIGKKGGSNVNPYRLQLGKPGSILYSKKKELSDKYGIFDWNDPELDKISPDYVFFTALNASEQTLLNGEIYYRITDPVFEEASKVGNSIKIELIRNISPAIEKVNSYKYKPYLLFYPTLYKRGYTETLDFSTEFFRCLKRYIPSINFTETGIRELIDWELNVRDYYIDLLSRLKPKAIFVSSFHYNAPLISAARSLGVKAVDIQHGIQVGYNPLYNNWSEMPKDGYDSLPNYFYVWGEKEANNIEKVFDSNSHSARIMGNPWFNYLEQQECEYSKQLETILESNKKKILLLLQSQTVIPELFKECINASDENIVWLIRHHPKGSKFIPKDFSNDLNKIFMSPELDNLPIVNLLKKCDITFSEGSTVAVEGDALGAVAFICSDTGYENYRNEIDDGYFYFIDNVQDFRTALVDTKDHDKKSKLNPFPHVDLKRLIEEL